MKFQSRLEFATARCQARVPTHKHTLYYNFLYYNFKRARLSAPWPRRLQLQAGAEPVSQPASQLDRWTDGQMDRASGRTRARVARPRRARPDVRPRAAVRDAYTI